MKSLNGVIAHIDVDYDEPKQSTYRSVGLFARGRKVAKFATGNFADDFVSAIVKLMQSKPLTTMMGSSVDHFTMDGKAWGWHTNKIMGELPYPIREKDEVWHRHTLAGKAWPRVAIVERNGSKAVVGGGKKWVLLEEDRKRWFSSESDALAAASPKPAKFSVGEWSYGCRELLEQAGFRIPPGERVIEMDGDFTEVARKLYDAGMNVMLYHQHDRDAVASPKMTLWVDKGRFGQR